MTEKKKKLYRSFFLYFFVRNILDLFLRTKRMPSAPININPNELRVWMIGHASSLVNLYGTTILTDPVLVHLIPFPKRVVKHGYEPKELPKLDYVVISHAHLDHLNRKTLRILAHKTETLILPRNCKDLVEGMGYKRVVELDWEESLIEGELKITAYRAEHWGKRMPWEKIDRGYNCFVFEKKQGTFFFGGDTGYGDYFKAIGQKHKIDLALLPISAYSPSYFRRHHMNPDDALTAAIDLGAKHIVPIHWGNFRLSFESLFEPPELFMSIAEEKGIKDRAHLLHNGETFSVPRKLV